MSTTVPAEQLELVIRREVPNLTVEQVQELAAIVLQLAGLFQPEQIYLFGSRARDDAENESDVDLLVVVPDSDQPGYRRDQKAYRGIERRFLFPLDILVVTRAEFEAGVRNRASLPATVVREGKMLYAAWLPSRGTAST